MRVNLLQTHFWAHLLAHFWALLQAHFQAHFWAHILVSLIYGLPVDHGLFKHACIESMENIQVMHG